MPNCLRLNGIGFQAFNLGNAGSNPVDNTTFAGSPGWTNKAHILDLWWVRLPLLQPIYGRKKSDMVKAHCDCGSQKRPPILSVVQLRVTSKIAHWLSISLIKKRSRFNPGFSTQALWLFSLTRLYVQKWIMEYIETDSYSVHTW